MMKYDGKTKALLRERGLKCICQLCDCGRPHKHQGCTKHWSGIPHTPLRQSADRNKSDYSSTYSRHLDAHPSTAFIPVRKPRNPKPPPMDFRTVNKEDFKSFGNVAKREPYQLKSELKSMSGNMEGKSTYRAEYKPHDVKPIEVRNPAKSREFKNTTFEGHTTYGEVFHSKVPQPNPCFSELPSFTYSILYPDAKSSLGIKSHTHSTHKELEIKKASKINPPISTLQLGVEGIHSLQTTHRETYQPVAPDAAAKIVRPKKAEKTQRPKFVGVSQFQEDFKGFDGKMPKPAKPITPPPETIRIGQNSDMYMDTTNRMEHRVTWDQSVLHREPLRKREEHYSPSKDKFDAKSMTHEDFKKHNVARVCLAKPSIKVDSGKARFDGETSYKKQFPEYHDVKVFRYGDFHESKTYLPPSEKFFSDGSVTQQDFKQTLGGKPRTPHKPAYNLHANGGDFYGTTNYMDSFQPMKVTECTFSQLMAEMQVGGGLAAH